MENNEQYTKPAFTPSTVIDLSYKHGGLPNRIWVYGVEKTVNDKEWMYAVLFENTRTFGLLSESFITDRMINFNSPIYHREDIQARYDDGWRWCGNYEKSIAKSNATLLKHDRNINGIRLYPALNPDGKIIDDYYGIWIKYTYPIQKEQQIPADGHIDIL